MKDLMPQAIPPKLVVLTHHSNLINLHTATASRSLIIDQYSNLSNQTHTTLILTRHSSMVKVLYIRTIPLYLNTPPLPTMKKVSVIMKMLEAMKDKVHLKMSMNTWT
jgi:hypothetical protein